MSGRSTAIPWAEIEAAYIQRQGSLADLAKRFGVGLRTIERHASARNWNDRKRALASRVSVAAVNAAFAEGKRVGALAAQFEAQQYDIACRVFDRVGEKTAEPSISASDLQRVAGAAVNAANLGRQALGLSDSPSAHPQIPGFRLVMRGPGGEAAIEVSQQPMS